MSVAKPANLHELAREALAAARAPFPDALADIEHRGDGECVVDGAGIVEILECVLGAALKALDDGESLWIRSSGSDPETLAIDVRWRGAKPNAIEIAAAQWAAQGKDVELSVEPDGDEQHVAVRFARSP